MPSVTEAPERLGARLTSGTVLSGRYRLQSILGAGGFGVVWRARHEHLETECAVKLFDPPPGTSPDEASARFLQEARVTARLKCPHVAQVFDYGVHEHMPFLVLELLRGRSLAGHLQALQQQSQAMPPHEVARIIRHVAEALQVAHAARVVHRDLKPDNIFLVDEGQSWIAKVLDFGIAKWSTDTSPSMTTTRTVMGTAHYMSPEQFESARQVDHRADLWSLGVIAFECLTGQLPFPGETFIDVAFRVCREGPLVASQIAAVPAGFDAWFARATAVERGQRFDSAVEQAQALARLCSGALGAATPAAPFASSRALLSADKGHLIERLASLRQLTRLRWPAWVGALVVMGFFVVGRLLWAGPVEPAAPQPSSSALGMQPSSSAPSAPGSGSEPPRAHAEEPRGPSPVEPSVRPLQPAAPEAPAASKRALAPTGNAGAVGADSARPSPPRQDATRERRSETLASAAPAKTASGGPANVPREGESAAKARSTSSTVPAQNVVAADPGADPAAAPGAPTPAISNFDRAAAKAALEAAAAAAQNCRPPGEPTGSGQVQVRYEPSGRVADVMMLTSKFDDTQTGSCVRMVFRRASVPAFQGAPVVVVNKSFQIPSNDAVLSADSPPAANPDACEPPWYVDAKGIRRLKPACTD